MPGSAKCRICIGIYCVRIVSFLITLSALIYIWCGNMHLWWQKWKYSHFCMTWGISSCLFYLCPLNSSSNYCCSTHISELWEPPIPVPYCGRSVAIIPVIEDFKFPYLEPCSFYPLSPTSIYVHHTETWFACCTYSKDDKIVVCFLKDLKQEMSLQIHSVLSACTFILLFNFIYGSE